MPNIPMHPGNIVFGEAPEPHNWAAKGAKIPAKKLTTFKLLMVGADVEMFLKDVEGTPVPCVGVVGGTKQVPIPLPGLPTGFAMQEDNVMFEFNIAPANSADKFISHIGMALKSIHSVLEPKGLSMNIIPAQRFEMRQLKSKQAQHIGCEPDFNVWERKVNNIVEFPEGFKNLRTSGGHVHVSFELDGKVPSFPQDIESMECVVMAMDVFLGIPLIQVEPANERRNLYGRAGAFRHKPYGIEYRTLSNYWISNSALTGYVYNAVEKCFDYLNSKKPDQINQELRRWKPYVTDAINANSVSKQQYVMQAFGLKGVNA